jgi:hypothetical protein
MESRPYLDLVERRLRGAGDPVRMPKGGLDRAQSVFRTLRLLATTFELPPVCNLARQMESIVISVRNDAVSDDMAASVRYAIESVYNLLRFVEIRAGITDESGGHRARARRRAQRRAASALFVRHQSRRPR